MAKHYILHFSSELLTPVEPLSDAVLRYLISGLEPERAPEAWPAHPFFSIEKRFMDLCPLPQSFAKFSPGDFVCEYWTDDVGSRSGVTLLIPSIRDLQGWFEALMFADWICSMARCDGCVGYIQDEEDRSAVSLLYSLGQALHFRDEKVGLEGVVRFTTGEPWCPRR